MKYSQERIARPTNDYDPAWIEYNKQNPYLFRAVGAEAADDGNDDGGNGEGGFTQADIDAAVKAGIDNAVSGLKKTNAELKAEKKETLDSLKVYKDLGYDPDQIKEILTAHNDAQDKELMDEGKIEELLSKRTDALRRDLETKNESLLEANQSLEARNNELTAMLSELKIDGAIREAALKEEDVIASAMVDILSRGRGVFSLSDSGELEARDSDGDLKMGKDGKAPLTIEEWVSSLKTDAPYFFKAPNGSGMSNSSGRNGGIDVSKMSAREKVAHANKMARA